MADRADSRDESPRLSARGEALRLLARRPRTREELVRRLTASGQPRTEIEELLERLEADGYVDDFNLSRDFIVARAQRLRHSRQRLLRDLEMRGVSRHVAEAAWKDAADAGDVNPRQALQGALSRILARTGGGLDSGRYRRVYNALLRAGHDRDLVRAELSKSLPTTDRNP